MIQNPILRSREYLTCVPFPHFSILSIKYKDSDKHKAFPLIQTRKMNKPSWWGRCLFPQTNQSRRCVVFAIFPTRITRTCGTTFNSRIKRVHMMYRIWVEMSPWRDGLEDGRCLLLRGRDVGICNGGRDFCRSGSGKM